MNTKNMPKIVLHLHLDGSLDLQTACKWLKEDGFKYTDNEVKRLLSCSKDTNNLNDYLTKFDVPCSLLQSKTRLEIATYELFKNLFKENVVYAEVRFSPYKHMKNIKNIDSVVESVIKGMNKAKNEFDIEGGIILCCMRNDSKEDNIKIVQTANKFINKGVVAIDLAGAEKMYPTKKYKYIFDIAKKLNVPFTIHAGEADGESSINAALSFKTKRIGHGVKCLENEKLIYKIISNNILLEVCPTSNIQTGAIESLNQIESLIKKGIKVSINTDNNLVSNITITKEYNKLINKTNITIYDIFRCNYLSIPYIFASNEVKDKLMKIFFDNKYWKNIFKNNI